MLIMLSGWAAFGEDQRPSPQVLVRTLLVAVLKAAPENLRENLLRAIGSGIKDQLTSLDFGSVSWCPSGIHITDFDPYFELRVFFLGNCICGARVHILQMPL